FAFAPGGQHMSRVVPLAASSVCVHWRWHWVPETASVVQTLLSLQSATEAGQCPAPLGIAVSHSSPDSSAPLPQIGWQSGSVFALPAGGQQLSLGPTAVIGVCEQAALQVPPESSVSVVHESLSLQSAVTGHRPVPVVIAVSQVSPASTTPLP